MQFLVRVCMYATCVGIGVLHAQEFRGTFSGSVTDRQGAANVIPPTPISAIAQKYLPYWPLPNLPGTAQGDQNLGITNTDSDVYDNALGRIDCKFLRVIEYIDRPGFCNISTWGAGI